MNQYTHQKRLIQLIKTSPTSTSTLTNKNVFPQNTEQSLPSALLSIHQQAFEQLSNTMSKTASETWQDVKAIDQEYAVTQRALGGLKGVGGLAEAAIGAIGVVAPEPLTSIGGVVLMAHGSDVAASGFNELWTGKPQETFTDKAVTATAKVLGASDATAHQIGDGVDMGISFGSAGVGLVQSARSGTAIILKPTEKVRNTTNQSFTFNAIENPGPLAKIEGRPATSFFGGKYNTKILKEDLVLYRGGNAGSPLGQWYTGTPPESVIKVRIDYAVKSQWIDPKTGIGAGSSPITTFFKIKIPKGTTIYEGPVGYQGGINLGGMSSNQIFVRKPWNLKGIKVLDSKLMK